MKSSHPLILSFSEGIRYRKPDLIDNRKRRSFALEPEAIIEFGVNQKNEGVGSIEEGGNLDMKLNVVDEKAEDGEDNDCKKYLAVHCSSSL